MHSIGSLLQRFEETFHHLRLFGLQKAVHELWVPVVRYALPGPYDAVLTPY